ncbi:EcsC family protein [Arenibacterium sp. LLYu02]|uniref:EcsC family protein n=1 Tax=Arenibacterium sp. LLYu02 TaxID=3404132 RepID=UPI003B20C750
MGELLESGARALTPRDVEAELDAIAARYRAAGSFGMRLLTALGGQAEGAMRFLPTPFRASVEAATHQALRLAVRGASHSRRLVPDQSAERNRWISTTMGMIGGAAGLPGALIELPATTTFLLRSIQGVAVTYGFDPAAENTRFDAIEVFASAGPLAHDDGAETGFLTLRLSLNGAGVSQLISRVAPKLAVALGPKLAAQMVPVLGAVAGGGVNYIYADYYQEMAHVHFALRRLALDADQPYPEMVERLRLRLSA